MLHGKKKSPHLRSRLLSLEIIIWPGTCQPGSVVALIHLQTLNLQLLDSHCCVVLISGHIYAD